MFEVDIEGFSGPLDLLCHLVESRELDPMGVKVGQVVALYNAWLGKVGGVSIDQLGEFISVAAKLVLEKTLAIAPPPLLLAEEESLLEDWGDEDLSDVLERYRPYRAAAKYLAERWRAQAGRRFRPETEVLWRAEYGDVFALALYWRDLLGRHRQGALSLFEDEPILEGVPDAIPDVGQVEHVMERVVERLRLLGPASLSMLLEGNRGRGPLAVTLLALLELARQHRVSLHQEEMFGDVSVQLQQTVETA